MRIVVALAAFTSTPASRIASETSEAFSDSSSIPSNRPAPRTSLTPGISAISWIRCAPCFSTFPRIFLDSINSIAAKPAAVVTGLPPNVEP